MWPRTDLTELLGTTHPILQAPMGGESTPALAIAVSESGGLGGLGCSFMSVKQITGAVATIRSATDRPFNLNFFVHPEPREDAKLDACTRSRVIPFYKEFGLKDVPERALTPCEPFNETKLAAVLDIMPKVVSFHFGLPSNQIVKAFQEAGSVILSTATTVDEAKVLQAKGVDAIIAQGWEAGGHRGTFDVTFEDFGIGTLALVPQVVDAVDVPVIAAGGIGDGRGIAAAFALGASGVQLGTAFLACPEANISDSWRTALREAKAQDTQLTRAFSGRPARAMNNRYMEAMAKDRAPLPDFPTMYAFSEPLSESSAASGSTDFQFLLYGQAATLNRELPAAVLMARLIDETRSVFRSQSVGE